MGDLAWVNIAFFGFGVLCPLVAIIGAKVSREIKRRQMKRDAERMEVAKQIRMDLLTRQWADEKRRS